MSRGIRGISRTSLWRSWKSVRGELRKASIRDVSDFLEYDIAPDVWINRLLRQIADGNYEPSTPRRFTLAKSKGFSRRMTLPAIPDLVLYRAIVDYLYQRGRRREHKHVYFERAQLAAEREAARKEAELAARRGDSVIDKIIEQVTDYEARSRRRMRAWLRYDQYRKHLILKRVYPYIVTTDITNFFDSVLHRRLAECFHSIAAPPRMVGLLFFLLERLSIRDAFSQSPHIGLPVDEFDCSRKLAHLVLFAHDDRMVELVGEDSYVRWMDDQTIGVETRGDGLRAFATLGHSLSRLHLAPNAGKSRLLSLAEAKRHFHLDINGWLDDAWPLSTKTAVERRRLSTTVRAIWKRAAQYEGQGSWDKILKRFYYLAGRAQTRMFRRRAVRDILSFPTLARRVCDYMRCTGKPSEFLDFADALTGHPEQVYPDVNLVLVESLRRLEAGVDDARRIRKIAHALLSGRWQYPGKELCMEVAPLIILRFADRRSLSMLRSSVENRNDKLRPEVVRSAAVVLASYGLEEYRGVRRVAAGLLRNDLAGIVLLVERVRRYEEVPGSYKQRLSTQFDSLAGMPYVDMRSVLAGRLLSLNPRKKVRSWLEQKRTSIEKGGISEYEPQRCIMLAVTRRIGGSEGFGVDRRVDYGARH